MPPGGHGRGVRVGSNGSGELGDHIATPSRNAPTAVASSFTQVAAGYNHTCGLTSAGTAYCWGSHTNGELGDNTTTKRDVPAATVGDIWRNGYPTTPG